MGSIYQRNGETCLTIAWTDQNGRTRTRRIRGTAGRKDHDVAVQELAKEERRVARGEAGLIDPFETTKRTPLKTLAESYTKSLAGKQRTKNYVRRAGERLELLFAVMGCRFLQDVTTQGIEECLAKLLAGEKDLPAMKPRRKGSEAIPRRPLSATTRDRYAESGRAFGAWLVATDRWPLNPFAKVRDIAGDDDRTMEHRAWTPDEVGALLEAATTRCVQEWSRTHRTADPERLQRKLDELAGEGWRRSVLYEFAAYTGLRHDECRTLTWGDVVLDGTEPSVTVKAARSKNRKAGQSVPLLPWVVASLSELRKRNNAERVRAGLPLLARDDRVFRIRRGLLEALRKDARWAELGDRDQKGRVNTFHGFRASTCTILHRAGVSLAVAVKIMRHADPKLTIDNYAKLDSLTDGHREMAKVAVPKVTAVPLTVQATVEERSRMAVGGRECPPDFDASAAQAQSPQRHRLNAADSGRGRLVGASVGDEGFEPPTSSL